MALVRRVGLVTAAALAFASLLPLPAFPETRRGLSLSAESVLLIDPGGRIIYSKNPDEAHPPASLVKMMTLYIALSDIAAGRARWDDVVTVSRQAAVTPRYRMGLRTGERVPLRVLLDGVGIVSANDAATAVAEHLANRDANVFVARMNAKARELGLTHTRFTNPHGLPDPFQRSTAKDLAELITRLLRDCPGARTILGGQTFVYRNRVYTRRIPLFKDPGGVEALKTGYTQEAGYNLAVAAWRARRQFLMIVLGAQSRLTSFLDARKILHYGFAASGLEIARQKRSGLRARSPARVRAVYRLGRR
jgi:D-alanyl-D-alanine carboxypeptidase (penicillin-binding protein 5/6)